MNALIKDIRFGLRVLLKNPGFTAVAVLTLALGISANTTIFSWINSTLLNPIPGITETSDLVSFMRGERKQTATPPCSYLDYVDLRSRNRSFSGLIAHHDEWMAFTGAGKPERIYGVLTSANYFDVLGVRPILGRGFLPEEEQKPGGAPVVVISYALWQNRFAADRAVLGRVVAINRHPYTIVGVAPPAFQGCKTGLRAELWVPLTMAQAITSNDQLAPRDNYWFNVFGQLKPGVTRHQAQAEMNLLMQQIVEQHPNSHKDSCRLTLDPLWCSPIGANSVLHVLLPMLMAIAGLVLLLACANVANLVLVHSVARRREFAIRLSIGASRWQLLRQLLVENLLLALAGGGLAFLVTTSTSKSFGYLIPALDVPISFGMHTDYAVFLATLFFSVLTGITFGLLPALRSSRISPAVVLKEESGSVSGGLHRSRLVSALVVAQISLSMLLLICAGLFIRSLQNAQRSNPGFDQQHVLLATFNLLPAGYSQTNGLAFDHQLLARIELLPGVEAATLADSVPLSFNTHTSIIFPQGYVPRPQESMEIGRAYVGPNYLRTMRIPLVAGRDLTTRDAEKAQLVAVINQALADRYWPGQDPLGKQIQTEGRSWTVVGVAQNSKWASLDDARHPFLFIPLLQDYYPEAILHLRVSGDPRALTSAVLKTFQELNPELPVYKVTTLESQTQVASFLVKIAATLVGIFGLVALLMAALGLYGVVAYATRQRHHEIGIRMALGGRKKHIYTLVLSQGLRLTLLGLAIGLLLSFEVTQLLRAQLFGVTSTDVPTWSSVILLLSATALIASWLPARRAVRTNPMTALRAD